MNILQTRCDEKEAICELQWTCVKEPQVIHHAESEGTDIPKLSEARWNTENITNQTSIYRKTSHWTESEGHSEINVVILVESFHHNIYAVCCPYKC